jgi:hypothetical protein
VSLCDFSQTLKLRKSFINAAGKTGYVALMVQFLKNQGATYPIAISAHNGPPNLTTTAYAESDAIMASLNGIGFGMSSVSVGDSLSYAQGVFPATVSDWAHNFKTYPAPIHWLQTYFPGYQFFASGYPISTISSDGSGNVTLHCIGSCMPFAGSPIYISGNSNPSFNISAVACPPSGSLTCPNSTTLEFTSTVPTSNGSGGTVWSPNYWPVMMPFAVQHGANTIEVYECDLDYAFGVWATTPTTLWQSGDVTNNVCVLPGSLSTGSPVGVSGVSDIGYNHALADTQNGQPVGTSVTGNANLSKVNQF